MEEYIVIIPLVAVILYSLAEIKPSTPKDWIQFVLFVLGISVMVHIFFFSGGSGGCAYPYADCQ